MNPTANVWFLFNLIMWKMKIIYLNGTMAYDLVIYPEENIPENM